MNPLDRRQDDALRARLRAHMPQPPPESFVPHAPHPRQAEFLALDCLEALYGGAAGGGKSDAILMAAAQYIDVPSYSALIIRRTFPELSKPGAIMDRAQAWWKMRPGVDWSEKDKRFTFPSGAVISFGYFNHKDDAAQYQSSEYQFIGVDELTELPELWYRFLFSRIRRLAGSTVPPRMRGATNPGGIGHEWVKARFIDEPTRAKDAVFVPALLTDNPSLDQASYRDSLAKLDETRRKQLELGEWVQDGGALVYGHFGERRNVASAPRDKSGALELTRYILGLDFGIKDQNAVCVLGWREHDTTVYVVEAYRKTAIVSEMAAEAKKLEQRYRFDRIVGDEGGMGKAFAEEMRKRPPFVPIQPAEKHNKVGYISLLNAELAEGRIKVDPVGCPDLLGEWRTLPWNEAHSKEAEGFDNHASDATLYAWRAAMAAWERPAEERPKTVEEYWAREEKREMAADFQRFAKKPEQDWLQQMEAEWRGEDE